MDPKAAREDYTELAMALRAPLFTLPVPAVLLLWGQVPWPPAVAGWAVAFVMAYLYGRWVRDDEEDEGS